ncbi:MULTISPECIES: SDR family oxidoreductase [Paraburkholderia]|uniref:UDP-glucose 4-epimerase family protein n=1 Tax=Paraburkholderia TaxID=1822464 RepID=UPI001609B99F|nr:MULTISPECIES: SDR family oxidoreductase [Paraburkholderia]
MSGVLVTGANGLVGRALCRTMTREGHEVTALVRRDGVQVAGAREWCYSTADFAGLEQAWPPGYVPDCVVHLAARVHVMNDEAPDPLAAFQATNVDGTLRVARAAQARGVPRMVFVSSIKAVAESDAGMPLSESTMPMPLDPYGISKRAAEEALWKFGAETGMEIVVVRPPLVYGPGVGANFLQMMSAVSRGLPLPLGLVDARRSLVYTDNLADALMRCATDRRAANSCFHVADNGDLSVAELLRALGRHLGRSARLLPVPVSLLRAAGALLGRSAQIERLTTGLQVNASRIREQLGWYPPTPLDSGLEATAHWFRATH